MERRSHAGPQPASIAGDVPRTLLTNWHCRGKRVVLLVRAGPPCGAGTGPPPHSALQAGRTGHSASDELRRRSFATWFRQRPLRRPAEPAKHHRPKRRIHGCKKYCACSPVSRKREIFHDRRFRGWFCWNYFGKLESGSPRSGERASQLARRGRRTGSYDNKTDREVHERDFTGN
jgi:hypothetical protein